MSIFFIDTSSLGKRYVSEVGSDWIRNLLKPTEENICIISELTLVETTSLFEKQIRVGSLNPVIAGLLQYQFLRHARDEYFVIPTNTSIMTSARKLVVKHKQHALRALDAIQLATAIHAKQVIPQPITFIASDNRLLACAVYEGFATDNPRLHE